MGENMEGFGRDYIRSLTVKIITRIVAVYLIMCLMFFLPAGTFSYWQAWAYMISIAVPMTVFGIYMLKHNPKFIERRLRTDEKREQQKLIQRLGILPFFIAFTLPGFDIRFGWSRMPAYISIAGLVVVLAGYLATLYVFIVNSYASRVVDVEKGQTVISTGPYSMVRHPMYICIIIFYLSTCIALGSYWAVIPASALIPVLVFRIIDEEKELLENLEGYKAYTEKVRYRLIPYIW